MLILITMLIKVIKATIVTMAIKEEWVKYNPNLKDLFLAFKFNFFLYKKR